MADQIRLADIESVEQDHHHSREILDLKPVDVVVGPAGTATRVQR